MNDYSAMSPEEIDEAIRKTLSKIPKEKRYVNKEYLNTAIDLVIKDLATKKEESTAHTTVKSESVAPTSTPIIKQEMSFDTLLINQAIEFSINNIPKKSQTKIISQRSFFGSNTKTKFCNDVDSDKWNDDEKENQPIAYNHSGIFGSST